MPLMGRLRVASSERGAGDATEKRSCNKNENRLFVSHAAFISEDYPLVVCRMPTDTAGFDKAVKSAE